MTVIALTRCLSRPTVKLSSSPAAVEKSLGSCVDLRCRVVGQVVLRR